MDQEQKQMNSESNAEYKLESNTIFIPAYGALVAKQFSNFDIKNGTLDLEFTLIIRLVVEGLSQEVVDKLQSSLKYRLNENEREAPLGKMNQSDDNKQFLSYTIRENSTIRTKDSMRLSPFEILSFVLKVELSHLNHNNDYLRFIFHIHSNSQTNLSFKDECDCLAEFNVIKSQSFITVGQESKDSQIFYYPIISYTFKIYREPGNKILTVFLPQFILGAIIIVTNERCQDFDNKISIVATLLLAYIAFIPSVREEMPSLPYATLSDYVIYTYMICCIVPLISEEAGLLPCRVIVYALTLIPVFIIACLFFWYKLKKSLYDRNVTQMKTSSGKFNSTEWHNPHLVQ